MAFGGSMLEDCGVPTEILLERLTWLAQRAGEAFGHGFDWPRDIAAIRQIASREAILGEGPGDVAPIVDAEGVSSNDPI